MISWLNSRQLLELVFTFTPMAVTSKVDKFTSTRVPESSWKSHEIYENVATETGCAVLAKKESDTYRFNCGGKKISFNRAKVL